VIKIERFVVGLLQTNSYLVYDAISKEAFLIDPGDFSNSIKSFIEKKALQVEAIINTHGHLDHISGNEYFPYPVMIHEKDKERLAESQKEIKTLKDGDTIGKEKLQFKVIHTPGHTPGGICLLWDNTLFSGDTLFYEGVGRTDLEGGDEKALFNSITKRLMVLPNKTVVHPGHGSDTTIGHEKKVLILDDE